MDSKSEDYWLNAESCRSVAERTSDPATKALLLGMATAWHNLAKQADRNCELDLVYETPPPQQQQPVAQQQQQVQPDKEPDE